VPRWLDVLISAVLLVALAPVLVVVAVLVAATSTGPVLFRQERVGRNGRPFTLLKFRTMTATTGGSLLTVGDDARVTRIGRPLRRYRLDELLQLVNVLRGDMALVGPRPELPDFVDERLAALLDRRPGITDPASLAYRDEAALLAQQEDPDAFYRQVLLPAKAQLSADYARRRTCWTDLWVLLRTARCLIPGTAPGEAPTPLPHS
jgi:lipopolysaccharide/colanic/teichoic acid biosynthesis glycosyltransferase